MNKSDSGNERGAAQRGPRPLLTRQQGWRAEGCRPEPVCSDTQHPLWVLSGERELPGDQHVLRKSRDGGRPPCLLLPLLSCGQTTEPPSLPAHEE